jgi:hypothetical protein
VLTSTSLLRLCVGAPMGALRGRFKLLSRVGKSLCVAKVWGPYSALERAVRVVEDLSGGYTRTCFSSQMHALCACPRLPGTACTSYTPTLCTMVSDMWTAPMRQVWSGVHIIIDWCSVDRRVVLCTKVLNSVSQK